MISVFAYGTLRPSLYPASAASVSNVRPAVLRGPFQMYDLGRFPALVWGDTQGRIVGEVFDIERLEELDVYEGYVSNGTGLYDRKLVEVTCGEDKVLAWVYFMHKETFNGEGSWVPSGDWANVAGEKRV